MTAFAPTTRKGQDNAQGIRDGLRVGRTADCARSEHNGRIAALFAAHNRALLRFLNCRLKSMPEAMEVAQEAYVRLLQLDTSDGIGYLRAFLFKTAANLAADRLKSVARRERIDKLEFFVTEVRYEPSPETEIAARQEVAAILNLLDELPARCRYVFVMHRFYGHSIAEVAHLLNLSVRTTQLYVERALVFCRSRLQDSSGGRNG